MNYTFMSEYELYYIVKDAVEWEITEYLGGYHIKVEYPNGYGASIAKHNSSYGHNEDLWELAVLHNGEIACDTSIASDTVGYLDDDEVASFCQTIQNWDEDGMPTNGWSLEEECIYYEHYVTKYDQERLQEQNDKADEALEKWYAEHPEQARLDGWIMEDEDEWYDGEWPDAK